jgi:hypothetical protein
VDKIDGVTNSIQHIIPLITVQTTKAILVLKNTKFNPVSGLVIESATVNGDAATALNVSITTQLKITIDSLHADFERMQTALGGYFNGDATTGSKVLPSVSISSMTLKGPFGLELQAKNISLDQASVEMDNMIVQLKTENVIEASDITAKYFCGSANVEQQTTCDHGLIDTETIFMFHDQNRAPPIASDESTAQYREHKFSTVSNAVR